MRCACPSSFSFPSKKENQNLCGSHPNSTTRRKSLTEHLIALSRSAPNLPVQIPPEIVEYVESGRNPDIYTREFIELVQRTNDHLRGKALAFRSFRDVLAREISGAMPELREEVERVVRETGGREPLGSWTGPAEGN